ncbi:transcription factor GTE2-like [Phragmites australis]|uniref:transcription factor GTE2-like n=1 Tax=Phragmites australis TaxID=29695 RepID=UPI002D7A1D18|nr:transcription factor GTE2-like [Phragmites australis]
MASALLADRSGAHQHHNNWGETRTPLATIPPNPNLNHRLPRADGWKPTSVTSPPASYVTFRTGSMGHREACALRDRLSGELGQVRALLSRIDTWQQQSQPKRHGSPLRDHPPPPAKLQGAMRKRCGQILTKLRKDKRSVWFNAPVEVDRLGLHDYHTVIKSPMDLGTVKENLAAGRYPSLDAFAADVRLIFSNALRYNPAGHEVHTFAGALLAYFEKMYKAAVAWFEEECKRLEPPRPVPVELPPPAVEAKVKPRTGNMKMRKPKAREPNKREMSLEEKDMLRLGLESLPEEKMHNVLQIVRKRNSNPEMLGDEIELDIDEMDVETQWELDRFVTNCNKALKKSQRAAMTNGGIADITDAVVAEDSIVPVNGTVPTLVDNDDAESENPVKSTTMAEQVDEYIDIGDEMPTATYQSMEIEKDAEVASGSGGSGSGSSSTGSESGSSGDSASGAGNAHSLV